MYAFDGVVARRHAYWIGELFIVEATEVTSVCGDVAPSLAVAFGGYSERADVVDVCLRDVRGAFGYLVRDVVCAEPLITDAASSFVSVAM